MALNESRPNILVVHPHNLGRYLGCYGRSVVTDHIDSIAAEGIQFERFFCPAAHCSPARGSLWTGNYPHNNGLVGLAHLGWELNDDEKTLVEYLNELDYRTYLFGVQHISSDPDRLGAQYTAGSIHEFSVDEPAAEVAARVEEFLLNDVEGEEPFFASVGFSEVHREPLVDRCLDCGWTYDIGGYESTPPGEVEPLPYLPDRPGIREDLGELHGMVRAIDEAVGRIDEALANAGLKDGTLLIFTTDHGIGFPRAMGTCYDPGVEAALVMRWPDEFDTGVVHDELLSNVDFMPTILGLLGEESPGDIDGRSFHRLLTDGGYPPREQIFLEFTWHAKYNPMRAVRTDRFKYVRNFGDVPLVYLPSPIFSSKAGREVRAEYYSEQRPSEELYDLAKDPHEQMNLVGNTDHEDVLASLRREVDEWMVRTDDSLIEGDWPATSKQEQRIKKAPWVPRDLDEFC